MRKALVCMFFLKLQQKIIIFVISFIKIIGKDKMKRFNIFQIITIISIMLLVSCKEDVNTPNNDPLVGKFSWIEWQQKANWDDYSADDYTPDENAVKIIADSIKTNQYGFILFTSNWCPDCKLQMPRIIKLFDKIGFDKNKCDIYGLDYKKTEPSGIYLTYEIKRVPTLIILKNNSEVGRVVETPTESWEQDILKIISN